MKQRQSIILKGDPQWCRDSTLALLTGFDIKHCICLSNQPLDAIKTISTNKAQTVLGQEFDAVIMDGTLELNPDSLGAMVGTIVAGGALIIMLNEAEPESLWVQRFLRISEHYQQISDHFHFIRQQQALTPLSTPNHVNTGDVIVNSDQQQAIDAVLKVVSGHRRRPLVLSADRGRGKSAALGMAAAVLIKQGKHTILVTAPSFASAETVFEHAHRLLPQSVYSQGQLIFSKAIIKFVAPDVLLDSDYTADLVLVDEAAAIPAAILEQLLDKFSRIVFSSTIHGYEGTGRGFAVRFQQTLDVKTPNWNNYHITQPIRWREDDLLEQFSFDALLLNAVAEPAGLIENATVSSCQLEKIERHSLLKDEAMLRSLFGLMVLAHYRTRPSDLMMLLDRDDISVYIMRFEGQIVASAWCVKEGGLEAELAEAIYAGERRLKGHLLPQSLLAHAGLIDAGSLSYQRIIRIAVSPELQSRGIGQYFVKQIVADAEKNHINVVGVSFASNVDLIHFWSKCNFEPIRLGLHHDDVSGCHAMMMLTPLSDVGQALINAGVKRFSEHWPVLLQQQFQHLPPALVITISQLLTTSQPSRSALEVKELSAFSFQQRGFDFCQIAVSHAVRSAITQARFLALSEQQQALCVMFILQQRQVGDVSQRLGFTGKAQLIKALREAIAKLLD
jgi:tRNA(Met) cytidine acetyltransferase